MIGHCVLFGKYLLQVQTFLFRVTHVIRWLIIHFNLVFRNQACHPESDRVVRSEWPRSTRLCVANAVDKSVLLFLKTLLLISKNGSLLLCWKLRKFVWLVDRLRFPHPVEILLWKDSFCWVVGCFFIRNFHCSFRPKNLLRLISSYASVVRLVVGTLIFTAISWDDSRVLVSLTRNELTRVLLLRLQSCSVNVSWVLFLFFSFESFRDFLAVWLTLCALDRLPFWLCKDVLVWMRKVISVQH